MRNKKFIYTIFAVGSLILSGPLRVRAQESEGFEPRTELRVLSSYDEFIALQKSLQAGDFKLAAVKGLPDGIESLPDSHSKYFEEILSKSFESSQSYIGHYYKASSCPGFNSSELAPFIEINFFEYTTTFLNSVRILKSLQISALKSWYENGECKILPAIASLEWESE